MSKCTIIEEKKKVFIEEILPSLIANDTKAISNNELMKIFKEDHGYNLSEIQMTRIGIRELLEEKNIFDTRTYQMNETRRIIDETIKYCKKQNIKIKHTTHLHELSEKFGNISRGTIDNNLEYIQQQVSIEKIPSTKRIESLDITDMELLSAAGKYFLQKNQLQVRAADIRKYIVARYRRIDIKVIYDNKKFFKDTYNIEFLKNALKEDTQNLTNITMITKYLKTFSKTVLIQYVEVIQNSVTKIDDNFIVTSSVQDELSQLWQKYIHFYIEEFVGERVNVKNGLLDENGKICLDTEKKKTLLLMHKELHINNLDLEDIIKLSFNKVLSKDKHYGIHFQNFYIGFLLYLYSKKLLLLPFSYVYEVCFVGRKVSLELPYFLKNNQINDKLMRSIQENRLEEKDDKYKRIVQFLLLSFPNGINLAQVKYEQISILRNKKENDFKRVVKVLNSLGADISLKTPKLKYVDDFMRQKQNPKHTQLIELFEKTMNRVAKLGNYAKEESVYKDYSTQYAKFMTFLDSNFSDNEINENFLYRIFNYPDEEKLITYQEYVENSKLSAQTKESRFTPLIVAFSQSKWKSLHNIKDTKPVFSSSGDSVGTEKFHKPITNYEALEKIKEVLKNDPPISGYYKMLNIDEKYTKWWPHYYKVAPFEPLILLMHLYIPARGGNFRHADRERFVVYNEKNDITGYHFGHDKNKKRKKPYIAPNIWQDELDFVEDLVNYSRVHFPDIKPIKIDKQNPQGIIPLFPNQDGDGIYTENMHMKYWKKVLLKAQILLNNDPKAEPYTLIYPNDDSVKLPQTSEEVDLLSEGDVNNYIAVYTLHSLRHTGATRYANAGMPYGLLMLLTGHVDPSTLQNIYVEIDREKMLKEWDRITNEVFDEVGMSSNDNDLFLEIEKKVKQILATKNPEKILEFLNKGKFISIGSYLGKSTLTQYTNEDFSKIDPVFWTPKRTGICTSNMCPNGLENRCSLCPHFLTSPLYLQEITAYINLQNQRLIKYVNMIIMNRGNGLTSNNDTLRKSAQIELEDLMGWMEIIKLVDNVSGDDTTFKDEESQSKELQSADDNSRALYRIVHNKSTEHTLLRVVFENLESRRFVHEGMYDAMETLVGKLIRYAAKNGRYMEIDGKGSLEILEWFQPQYKSMIKCENTSVISPELIDFLAEVSDTSINNELKQLGS